MKPQRNNGNPLRVAGAVGAMGVDIAVSMVLGYFIADWLSGGSRGWIMFGIVAGLAAGVLTCAMLLKRLLEDRDG